MLWKIHTHTHSSKYTLVLTIVIAALVGLNVLFVAALTVAVSLVVEAISLKL